MPEFSKVVEQFKLDCETIDIGRVTIYKGDTALDVLDELIEASKVVESSEKLLVFYNQKESWYDVIVPEEKWGIKVLHDVFEKYTS